MRNYLIFLFFAALIISSCKKYEYKKNVWVNVNVTNVCTGKPFNNCKVYFKVLKKKNRFSKWEQINFQEFITDNQGNISFVSDIDYSSNVKYFMGIEDINESTKRLEGISGEIMKEKFNELLKFGVSGLLYKLVVKSPCVDVNYPQDSFSIKYYNRYVETNFPKITSRFELSFSNFKAISTHITQNCYHNNHSFSVSGMWTFETERWKNGQYSKVIDSLFIDYADSATYQIPW